MLRDTFIIYRAFLGYGAQKGIPPPPNSRTGYENLRDTPIIYRATLGYAARQGIPPPPSPSSQF